jgi:hypothetical protein
MNGRQEVTVIISGGNAWVTSEILVVGGTTWTEGITHKNVVWLLVTRKTVCLFPGPKLPKAIKAAAMASYPDASKVVFVGGQTASIKSASVSQEDIYELNCSPDGICEWKTIPLKLSIARHSHVAMFVPGNMVDCDN